VGTIELRMAILTGAVAGLLLVLIEGIAMHRKVSIYRGHLRGLFHTRRFFRLLAEIGAIVFVVLLQPVVFSVLTAKALDNFNPKFSAHAMAQLKQGIHDGGLKDDGPPERH
jgi:uncharacterized membrane protein